MTSADTISFIGLSLSYPISSIALKTWLLYFWSFINIIGLNKLGCIHINDSKNERGMKKDRHENFGFGYLGFDTLINIIYNPRIESIPKILETPWIKCDKESYPPYKFEIEMIRNKKFDPNVLENIINYYKN